MKLKTKAFLISLLLLMFFIFLGLRMTDFKLSNIYSQEKREDLSLQSKTDIYPVINDPIRITGTETLAESSGVRLDAVSDSHEERGFTSDATELNESDYVVLVSLPEQRVFIYHKGIKVRQMICSSGLVSDDNETPTGRFIINESGQKRGEWFFSEKYGAGAQYWTGFIGGEYLFHSLPMDRNKNIIKEEAALLGRPASHGCIRLSVDDAYWFYNTVPSGSVLYISGTPPQEEEDLSITESGRLEENTQSIVLEDPLLFPNDVTTWLFAHEYEYYQQHLLSCEAALIRLVLGVMGIRNLDEESVIDSLPKGADPEESFVCDNIDQGRRMSDGTILWNNYGTHPPVVVQSLKSYMNLYGLSNVYTVEEMKLSDDELKDLVTSDDRFLGAIIWLIGHPDRWGVHPPVNERGIVLGEHVRFVNPELDEEGNFMVWDPESHPYQPYRLSSLPTRDMFDNRVVTIFRSDFPIHSEPAF